MWPSHHRHKSHTSRVSRHVRKKIVHVDISSLSTAVTLPDKKMCPSLIYDIFHTNIIIKKQKVYINSLFSFIKET